jgi:hypothetical protein
MRSGRACGERQHKGSRPPRAARASPPGSLRGGSHPRARCRVTRMAMHPRFCRWALSGAAVQTACQQRRPAKARGAISSAGGLATARPRRRQVRARRPGGCSADAEQLRHGNSAARRARGAAMCVGGGATSKAARRWAGFASASVGFHVCIGGSAEPKPLPSASSRVCRCCGGCVATHPQSRRGVVWNTSPTTLLRSYAVLFGPPSH